jgi:hypothetical protein
MLEEVAAELMVLLLLDQAALAAGVLVGITQQEHLELQTQVVAEVVAVFRRAAAMAVQAS